MQLVQADGAYPVAHLEHVAPVNTVEQTVHNVVLEHLLQLIFTAVAQEVHSTLIFPEAPALT